MADVRTEPRAATTIIAALLVGFAGLAALELAGVALVFGEAAWRPMAAAGAALLATFAALAWLLVRGFARPLDRLALDLAIIAGENPGYALATSTRPWLGRLMQSIDAMRARLASIELRGAQALGEAQRRGAEQKRWLEAILLDLTEGIIVCNLQHQVLLYNQAAAEILGGAQSFGLGRPIFPSLTREPVLHALERQIQRLETGWAGRGTRFMCGTAEAQRLLGARLVVVRDAAGSPNGYVLSFAETGEEDAALAKRDDLLDLATESLRAPIANLRAAAETLAQSRALTEAERSAARDAVLSESAALGERFDTLARGYRELGEGRWIMAEIYSSDLIASLKRHLIGSPVVVTETGLPYWLYGDSLSLLVLLEFLLRQLQVSTRVEAFDIALSLSEKRIYLDLVWNGPPVATGELESWLDRPLTGGLGPLTGRIVLRRHGSDAWSQAAGPDAARLRISLASALAKPPRERPLRPGRPEFYDFDLLHRPAPAGRFAEYSLKELTYVAFDLETTGLMPTEGDEVISIGAVRIVNGRILTSETFERLVNPGRSVPEASVRFHGITDDMVRDKPPFAMVLPAFHRFAADAVLVAHNAAFDISFLYRAAGTSISFDQPIVDTLLLSAYLHPEETDHSLDAIAARLGLEVVERHSALGDSLLTAAILLRLLDQCEQRGILRLDHLLASTDMTGQLRARQLGFERRSAKE
ncbi:MAG TPA: exonuclease domain-containing protein [Stellaceae bacterium]|nr:exonuclease domain-containing protein [Stellaceae bacterium]